MRTQKRGPGAHRAAAAVSTEIEYGLTYVVRGCIFMTDAARQRCPEGRAPQSRTGLASASRATFRCGRTPGAGLLDFAASSLPIPRTSSATEGAGTARRSQIGIYGQASTQPDSASPGVRHNETIVYQRGGQPGVARAAAARTRAWVSRSQFGHGLVAWNIDLIVCCRTNWRKRTSCWCRTNGGQSAGSEKERWNRQKPTRR